MRDFTTYSIKSIYFYFS